MLLPIFTLDIHEIFDHFAAAFIYRTVSKKCDLSAFLLVCMEMCLLGSLASCGVMSKRSFFLQSQSQLLRGVETPLGAPLTSHPACVDVKSSVCTSQEVRECNKPTI